MTSQIVEEQTDFVEEKIKEFEKYRDLFDEPHAFEKVESFIRSFASTLIERVGKEVCICAAIKSEDGKVFRGQRHGDCMYAADRAYWSRKDIQGAEQGFITYRVTADTARVGGIERAAACAGNDAFRRFIERAGQRYHQGYFFGQEMKRDAPCRA